MNISKLVESVRKPGYIVDGAWETMNCFAVSVTDEDTYNRLKNGEELEGGTVYYTVDKNGDTINASPVPEFMFGEPNCREIPFLNEALS